MSYISSDSDSKFCLTTLSEYESMTKEAEKQYFSYVEIETEKNSNVISVEWYSKISSIYITDNKVKRGCTIQGSIRGAQKEFKYIGNVKENFAQRMANRAFADGNRVGISLAKMEV